MSQQMQQQQQRFVEQELQLMYLYDDFNNFVGIANETQAVLDYFKDDREHPMVNINLNRLILQANLSNGVYMDQQENDDGRLLQETKKDLKQLYQKVMGNPDQYDERIAKILKSYLKNLEPIMELHQIDPLPTKKVEFNQDVVYRLVDGMNFMDNQVQQINNGDRYQKKTTEEIKTINQQRKQIAQAKLAANFPHTEIVRLQEEEILSEISQEIGLPKAKAIYQSFFQNQIGVTQKSNQFQENQINQDSAHSFDQLRKKKIKQKNKKEFLDRYKQSMMNNQIQIVTIYAMFFELKISMHTIFNWSIENRSQKIKFQRCFYKFYSHCSS